VEHDYKTVPSQVQQAREEDKRQKRAMSVGQTEVLGALGSTDGQIVTDGETIAPEPIDSSGVKPRIIDVLVHNVCLPRDLSVIGIDVFE
jgi:hypothetical protein